MNNRIKNVSIILNVIILLIALYWLINPQSNVEPLIVIVGQSLSIVVLFYGNKIQHAMYKTRVKSGDKLSGSIKTGNINSKGDVSIKNDQ